MSSVTAGRLATLGVAVTLVVLATGMSGPVASPPKITGKLSRGGYTVIALAAGGTANSVKAKRGTFSLVPPATAVTLHLRAANGRYAGPIVIGGHGKQVVVGVKAGARLGRVLVRAGYAKVARPVRRKWLARRRWAKARAGVPIGARVFGYVRTTAPSTGGPGLDQDRDGLPNLLDVDDDGDLVLDNLERLAGAQHTGIAGLADAVDAPYTDLASSLTLDIGETVNANAAALTDAQLDSALSTFGIVRIGHPAGGNTELDCGGLPYCSPGGTGRIAFAGPEQLFPSCCDPDSDGFGTMPIGNFGPSQFFLRHGATTGQIRTGDVLIQRFPEGETEQQVPVTLQTVFGTVPALTSYADGAGHSATVAYPVPQPIQLWPVSAGPGSDVVLTFTFWRPQRRPIGGETGDWVDIGGLFYHAEETFPHQTGPPFCPPSTYSTSDPNLVPDTIPFSPSGGFRDLATDQPANPSNTLTFSLNMTACLASQGRSWNPGDSIAMTLTAGGNAYDNATQRLHFRREA